MTSSEFLESLGLPPSARVERVVPKKLLVENGMPTAADRKAISSGIEKILWLAALKPSGIGVPEYKDESRHYVEIAVVAMVLRSSAKMVRLRELLHRAIPYPVLLMVQVEETLDISIAEKRLSERQTGKYVLESGVTGATLPDDPEIHHAFALAGQPKTHLRLLYQGWRSVIEAIQASAITGRFELVREPNAAITRREAIEQHDALVIEIARLRSIAAKERQVARRVELNLQIQQLQSQLQNIRQSL